MTKKDLLYKNKVGDTDLQRQNLVPGDHNAYTQKTVQ